MKSAFQMHKARVAKRQAEAKQREQLAAGDTKTADLTTTEYAEFEVLKTSLENDVQTLSGIQDRGKKDEFRKEALARYQPHLDAYLKGDKDFANPVLVQCMIWKFDLKNIPGGLELAAVAIAHKQVMPKNFKRNVDSYVADSVREWLEVEIAEGNSPEPFMSEVYELLPNWDVNDAIRMKWAKLIGLYAYTNEDWQTAVTMLEKAKSYETGNLKPQVDTKLANARKALEKQRPADSDDSAD